MTHNEFLATIDIFNLLIIGASVTLIIKARRNIKRSSDIIKRLEDRKTTKEALDILTTGLRPKSRNY